MVENPADIEWTIQDRMDVALHVLAKCKFGIELSHRLNEGHIVKTNYDGVSVGFDSRAELNKCRV